MYGIWFNIGIIFHESIILASIDAFFFEIYTARNKTNIWNHLDIIHNTFTTDAALLYIEITNSDINSQQKKTNSIHQPLIVRTNVQSIPCSLLWHFDLIIWSLEPGDEYSQVPFLRGPI